MYVPYMCVCVCHDCIYYVICKTTKEPIYTNIKLK